MPPQFFYERSSQCASEPILNRSRPIVMKQVGIECHQQLVFVFDRELHLVKAWVVERNINGRSRIMKREQPSFSQSDRATERHLPPCEPLSGCAEISIRDRTADAFIH